MGTASPATANHYPHRDAKGRQKLKMGQEGFNLLPHPVKSKARRDLRK